MKYFMNLFYIALFIILQFIMQSECFAIDWIYDMKSALEIAGKQNKAVMVDFSTDWCGWCKKLDKETYGDSRVGNLAKNFVCLKIDGDKERGLVAKYNINGYPTIVFLDSSGKLIDTVVGFRDVQSFIKILENILTNTTPKNIKTPEKKAEKKEEYYIPEKKEENNKLVVTDGFIYDGYIKSSYDSIKAQVRYQGRSYILNIGDEFEDYVVEDISTSKIVLKHGKKRVVVRYNKAAKNN